ncbi:uncharacterized protein LOC111028036 [Myzus persicae]|uniref:uncharacterized protein LOC111028036 n=1 Tax=Myzus persicae TaxID=13164 RepID=UPI000B932828|nr:uncharacterized protein LOC111028036 [Myzus persicae]
MDVKTISKGITGMKKAKNGGILMEVRGDEAAVEAIRSEVANSAGQDVSVRLLGQKTMIKIRDIDAWTDKEEIADCIARETPIAKENINVVNLRASHGGRQTALVLLPTRQARDVVNKGRLKISVVSCRVRQAEKRNVRCFRCLAYGHDTKTCQGTDHGKNCRRCGTIGHLAKNCKAEAAEAAAFRSMLEKVSMEARAGTGENEASSSGRDLQ